MALCLIKSTLKVGDLVYPKGDEVDLDDALVARLPAGTVKVLPPRAEPPRADGPTFEAWVAGGEAADLYPPTGYLALDSPGWDAERDRRRAVAKAEAAERVAAAFAKKK